MAFKSLYAITVPSAIMEYAEIKWVQDMFL